MKKFHLFSVCIVLLVTTGCEDKPTNTAKHEAKASTTLKNELLIAEESSAGKLTVHYLLDPEKPIPDESILTMTQLLDGKYENVRTFIKKIYNSNLDKNRKDSLIENALTNNAHGLSNDQINTLIDEFAKGNDKGGLYAGIIAEFAGSERLEVFSESMPISTYRSKAFQRYYLDSAKTKKDYSRLLGKYTIFSQQAEPEDSRYALLGLSQAARELIRDGKMTEDEKRQILNSSLLGAEDVKYLLED